MVISLYIIEIGLCIHRLFVYLYESLKSKNSINYDMYWYGGIRHA